MFVSSITVESTPFASNVHTHLYYLTLLKLTELKRKYISFNHDVGPIEIKFYSLPLVSNEWFVLMRVTNKSNLHLPICDTVDPCFDRVISNRWDVIACIDHNRFFPLLLCYHILSQKNTWEERVTQIHIEIKIRFISTFHLTLTHRISRTRYTFVWWVKRFWENEKVHTIGEGF